MNTNPYYIVSKAAHVAAHRLTLGALGWGFEGIATPLVAHDDDTADENSEPIAFAMFDNSGTTEVFDILRGLCNGALPPLPNGAYWGEDGVISSLDVQTAWMNNNVTLVSAIGLDMPPAEWINGDPVKGTPGQLKTLGYKTRPTPEV